MRADHGIEVVRYAPIPSESDLDALLARRLNGETLTELECAQFSTAVQVWLGKRYAAMGWVMQLHIGAQRNNNTRMFQLLGADAGFDSISDKTFAFELAHLLDEMDQSNELPRTILYCLNPRDNEMMATMISLSRAKSSSVLVGGSTIRKTACNAKWSSYLSLVCLASLSAC